MCCGASHRRCAQKYQSVRHRDRIVNERRSVGSSCVGTRVESVWFGRGSLSTVVRS